MAKKHDTIWLDSVDSTNEEAARLIDSIDNLSVLSAMRQTEGKGQRGNTWSSDRGKNLTFSIVLKFDHEAETAPHALPSMKAYDQFVISEITALSVVDLLAEYGIQARIKWPNDIYVGDRKICGILIENSLRGTNLHSSIVGVGINVNQTEFPDSVPNPTSMKSETGEDQDIILMLEFFMEIFTDYLTRYGHIHGGYGKLRKMYHSQMWRKDEMAEFIENIDSGEKRRFRGTIKGLSDVGHLIIENEEGELREFSFKQISYIL